MASETTTTSVQEDDEKKFEVSNIAKSAAISNDEYPDIIEWLKQYRLNGNGVSSIFIKYGVTIKKLFKMNNDEMCKYLKNILNKNELDDGRMYYRIINRLKQFKRKPIYVMLTIEEDEAMKKMEEHNKKIPLLTEALNAKKQTALNNINETGNKTNSSFSELMKKIEEKQHETTKKLNTIQQEKNVQINEKRAMLNKLEKNGKNARKRCGELVADINIDKTERKNKIISIMNEIINEKIPNDDINNIKTDINFKFNDDKISKFLNDICSVYGDKPYPIPVISNVNSKVIDTQNATISWDAVLSKNDENIETKRTLKMKLEVSDEKDEKESGSNNSNFISFSENQKTYKFEMKSLTRNAYYKFDINLYENKMGDNQNTKLTKTYKPICVNFKTPCNDIDRSFVYQSDFDKNGILYYIGSNYGKRSYYSNVVSSGLVKVTPSKVCDAWASGDFVRRDGVVNYTANDYNSWIEIDFKSKIKIRPTRYTLRSDAQKDGSFKIRNWRFEGSNNGSSWTTIKSHNNDTSLQKKNGSHTWSVSCSGSYQMFRIYGTGVNSSSGTTDDKYRLFLAGFEIYGHCKGDKN